MFEKLLIANRGEIACRVMRTAARLGIRTVAVYSDADRDARHVRLADEAWRIGPPAARESYLRADVIIDVAKRAAAGAIHPGYGFLSENGAFAEACAEANIVFVGPTADAIRLMGSKSAAKAAMEQAGVPLVPGYHGDDQADARLRDAADGIGYPVLLKASAGGGGKGMRVVEAAAEFDAALASARRESASAFGDDSMLVEKYLVRPRHVEVQVFGDTHGHVVHLFERDCSVQRRHQKVLEEAPAPHMDEAKRAAMGESAVAAARAIGYVGAGTVEFIVDADGEHYFMEMNTRLQVEHPVTEMVTGQDLVEWQLRVAAGEPLPVEQEALRIRGHAIEARIYAEDPGRDFLPAGGTLRRLRFPGPSDAVRVDTGVQEGDQVGLHYDPMIAKLIVHGDDRADALRHLRRALAQVNIAGLTSNVGFLAAVAAHPAFATGGVDTGFIERHRDDLLPPPEPVPDEALALAGLNILLRRADEARTAAAASADPHSPWHWTNGWRLNEDNHHTLHFRDGEREVDVTVHYRDDGYVMELPSGELRTAATRAGGGELVADLGGVVRRATVLTDGQQLVISSGERTWRLTVHDPAHDIGDEDAAPGSMTAPMPGKVIDVLVSAGEEVTRGQPLLVLEAMKMEHTIKAPADGRVAEIRFRAGDVVDDGAELLVLDTECGT